MRNDERRVRRYATAVLEYTADHAFALRKVRRASLDLRHRWPVHRSDIELAAVILTSIAAVPAAFYLLLTLFDYGLRAGWW